MKKVSLALVVSFLFSALTVAQPASDGTAVKATATPTFECIGISLRYRSDGDSTLIATPQYRRKGESAWRDGLALYNDKEDKEFRGSLVNLQPNTAYEILVKLADADGANASQYRLEAQTWNEEFPIAETVWIEPGVHRQTLIIDRSGTEKGYILYSARPGKESQTILDVDNTASNNVDIRASYVIVRGLTCKGAQVDGIRISSGDHIVIERCHITGWGREGGYKLPGNGDSAIHGWTGEATSHVVIQDNVIELPRGCSNNWDDQGERHHPNGPQGINFEKSGGSIVIRYNRISSNDQHRYNDGIGTVNGNGLRNSFLHHDSDVYGNYISHCSDDALEMDGGNYNVRVWANRVEHAYVGISLAAIIRGPLYAWRNVFTDVGAVIFKLGGGERDGFGAGYLFHNSAYYASGRHTFYSGTGSLANKVGKYPDRIAWFRFITGRNNIVSSPEGYALSDVNRDPTNSFDYDLLHIGTDTTALVSWGKPERDKKGNKAAPEQVRKLLNLREAQTQLGFWKHGLRDDPRFTDPAAGVLTLRRGSPAIDKAVRIPNFNDRYTGSAPDMGAIEFGEEQPHYGPRAPITGAGKTR